MAEPVVRPGSFREPAPVQVAAESATPRSEADAPLPAVVHLVAGPDRERVSELIAGAMAQRAETRPWAWIGVSSQQLSLLEASGPVRPFDRLKRSAQAGKAGSVTVTGSSGCPCCVGAVAFQATLVDLLRRERPSQVWVQLDESADLSAMVRTLSGPSWASALQLAPTLVVAGPADVDRLHQYGPETPFAGQLKAADRVVWVPTLDEPEPASLREWLVRYGGCRSVIVGILPELLIEG